MTTKPAVFQPQRKFSQIYLEEGARDYPLTKELLAKFNRAEVIPISNYAEIFNRSKQDFQQQKSVQKMILAKKQDNLLYEGSSFTPDFGAKNFYYNAMALNCLYNCEYCYLQGMFKSGHLVIFVNEDDFYQAALQKLKTLGSLYLSISYDTDLLAIENLTGYCANWSELCGTHPGLSVECRTKSVNVSALIKSGNPPQNFILAWTLSPADFSGSFEQGTPGLLARVEAIKQVIAAGYSVRICFDPVMPMGEWHKQYRKFLDLLSDQLDFSQIRDLTIGSFRMNKEYFKQAKSHNQSSPIYNYPFEQTDRFSKTAEISTGQEERIKEFFETELGRLGIQTPRYYM